MIDETRFIALYEQTSKRLLAYLVRISGDPALAADVCQEAYVRMLQADLRDPTDQKLRSYLFTSATNIMRDHWRRSRRQVSWEGGEDMMPAAPGGEEEVNMCQTLEGALERLSPQQRSLLWLAYAEDYTHREIAAILHLREGSVRVLLSRARGKLAAIFRTLGIAREDLL